MSSVRLFIFLLVCIISVFSIADDAMPKQYLPVDSDNDGVVDDKDDCYKTRPGAVVDERGCYVLVIETETIRLNINFDFDSAIVKPEYFSEIVPVAELLKQQPLSRVVVEGHTDSDGSLEYNKSLSQRRANAVARVLVTKFGIPSARVTAVGFGEERPLVANDSKENKAKNRRVVAVISTTQEKQL